MERPVDNTSTLFRASNVVITGGSFNLYSSSNSRRGRDIIAEASSPKAFYDSNEQYETPKTFTDDQVAVKKAIEAWIFKRGETETSLMWLYGSAWSGKSSVARSIADQFAQEGILLSSYFFSRTDPSRNSASSFIATIAYGIIQTLSSVQPLMELAMENEPLMFSLSVKTQFVKLVLEPLLQLYEQSPHQVLPYLIVIDGLDECIKTQDQEAVFHSLTSALDKYAFPWKILISSRNDQTIHDLFSKCLSTRILLPDLTNGFQLPLKVGLRRPEEDKPKTVKPQQCGLRMLSIDGGGIRGLSSLLILQEILYRIKSTQGLNEVPKPYEYFDVAGGSGTGGLLVLMLFRLRMTIETAIISYVKFAKYVFSEKKAKGKEGAFKSTRLEQAIVNMIMEQEKIDEDKARHLPLFDQTGPRCFVCATPLQHIAFPTIFRTWVNSRWPAQNCTIVEVARATSASPFFFKGVEIGDDDVKQTFINAGLNCNNPVKYVLEEAKFLPPVSSTSCIVSLGSGKGNVIALDKKDSLKDLVPVLQKIAEDCEETGEEVARQFIKEPDFYFRLNVDRGLQNVSMAEWDKLGQVKTHTDQYLKRFEVSTRINRIVEHLISERLRPGS